MPTGCRNTRRYCPEGWDETLFLRKAVKFALSFATANRACRLACRSLLQCRMLPFRFRKHLEDRVAWGMPPMEIRSFAVKVSPGKSIKLSGPIKNPELRDLYWWGREGHDPETMPHFARLVRSAGIFLDIGCNIGVYSLMAARLNPRVRVYAFEPVPEILDEFARNVALNKMAGRITAEPLAVSDRSGRAYIYVSKDSISSSSLNPSFRQHQRELTVETVTVDEYLKRKNIPVPDLVKIDVETHEPRVLEGMRGVLADGRTDIICEVLDGTDSRAMTDLLGEFGYQAYFITDMGLVRQEAIARRNDIDWRSRQNTPYQNYIFTKRTLPHIAI